MASARLRCLGAARLFAAALAVTTSSCAAAQVHGRWAAQIEEASARFGVPRQWISRVMEAESGGEPFQGGQPVVSSAGAMGLMQLMPGTWNDMRARLGLGGDPFDPRDNILAGTAYLRLMYDRFGYPGLFGAYNAGPARYAAFLRGDAHLPSETRTYLAKVEQRTSELPPDRGPAPASLFAVITDDKRDSRGAAAAARDSADLFVNLATGAVR